MEGDFADEDHQAPGQASDDLIQAENEAVEAQQEEEEGGGGGGGGGRRRGGARSGHVNG